MDMTDRILALQALITKYKLDPISFLFFKLFGDVCYHCNRVIEGDGEYQSDILSSGLCFNVIYIECCLNIQTFNVLLFLPHSGVCSQQGLVCHLFLMLHLPSQTHSQVSDVAQ